jgi:hypothetical protein
MAIGETFEAKETTAYIAVEASEELYGPYVEGMGWRRHA